MLDDIFELILLIADGIIDFLRIGWKEKKEIRPFTFLEEGEKSKGKPVTYVEFDSAAHSEFTYNAKNDNYVRTINGNKYIDKETGKSIKVKNVLVQKVTSRVLDGKEDLKLICALAEMPCYSLTVRELKVHGQEIVLMTEQSLKILTEMNSSLALEKHG